MMYTSIHINYIISVLENEIGLCGGFGVDWILNEETMALWQ